MLASYSLPEVRGSLAQTVSSYLMLVYSSSIVLLPDNRPNLRVLLSANMLPDDILYMLSGSRCSSFQARNTRDSLETLIIPMDKTFSLAVYYFIILFLWD